jgi:hypothetical protein
MTAEELDRPFDEGKEDILPYCLGNSRAPGHTKNDAIPANGVTAFGVVTNFSSLEPKGGVKLSISFCAAWAASVLFTSLLCAYLPARNDFFQKPVSVLFFER